MGKKASLSERKAPAAKPKAASASVAAADKRARFVKEYLIDRNATQAAIRAGYSAKTAGAAGHRLLKDVEISTAVQQAAVEVLDRLDVSKERITRQLAKIAFTDLSAFLTWGPDQRTLYDPETGAPIGKGPGVGLLPSDKIDPDALGALAEISETPQGMKIKLKDSLGALKLLGIELGMFKEQTQVDFNNPLRLIIEAVQREAAPLPINDPNAGRQLRLVPEASAGPAGRPVDGTAGSAAPRTISPLLRPPGGAA